MKGRVGSMSIRTIKVEQILSHEHVADCCDEQLGLDGTAPLERSTWASSFVVFAFSRR